VPASKLKIASMLVFMACLCPVIIRNCRYFVRERVRSVDESP
jgi:hypothetical protein